MKKYFDSWKECKECMYADAFRYVGDYGKVRIVDVLGYYLRHPNYRYVYWMRVAQYTTPPIFLATWLSENQRMICRLKNAH